MLDANDERGWDMSETTDSTTERVPAPPYISFRTLLNLVERMADEGIPRRIDRSYLSGLSGGYQTQVMAALRSLGLMADEGVVTDRLIDLVRRPADRKFLFGNILRERYPEAVRLGESNATQAELEEAFRPSGIGGATLRKAVTFYLHAADFAGIPLSPFFKPPTASSEASAPRRRRTRTTRTPAPSPTPEPTASSSPTQDELRTRYIDMLMKKVDDQDQMDEKLLDRIETLLGYGAAREEGEGEE
jgi:hypothetical protein